MTNTNKKNQAKLKQYNNLNTFVSNSVCVKSLQNLHNNILKQVRKGIANENFLKIAQKAKIKAIQLQLPNPISNDEMEIKAYNSYINAVAETNIMPNGRVIHFQLRKFGYAYALTQQAVKQTFSKMYKTLVDMGKYHLTAEYFVISNQQKAVA